MKLQTKVDIPSYPFAISYTDTALFIGSCFAEHIGNKITNLKYKSDTNPYGIMYNPASVSQTIQRIVSNQPFTEEDLTNDGKQWFSYAHHGNYSHPVLRPCLDGINLAQQNAYETLKKANYIFITLGTAWVYKLLNGTIVANCHKQPASYFERQFLSVDVCCHFLSTAIQQLRKVNPDANVVFTVSPIRHWKDGAHGNQLSKSVLLLSIERLQAELTNCFYFPVYEIFMDELRDYRWYADDMLHPSAAAINYVWEVFEHSFLSAKDADFRKKIEKINSAYQHKMLTQDKASIQKFALKILEQITFCKAAVPALNFDIETNYFNELIR